MGGLAALYAHFRRPDLYGAALCMVLHLRARGYDDTDLGWCPDPHGRHCEPDWRKRAPSALEFLFSGERGADSDQSREDEDLPADRAA